MRPRPYSRSMRPPLLTMRCRNACSSNCGPASLYWKRSSQCSECSRKNSWKAASSWPTSKAPRSSTYQVGSWWKPAWVVKVRSRGITSR